MKSYCALYDQLTSYENLEFAFKNARKRKTLKPYVILFESDLKENLLKLQFELQTFTYQPAPIKIFIVRDPKTRKIGASDFRDRVVHHALCNVISPVLDNRFIPDSFANRKGKGTHKAIERFEQFLKTISPNHTKTKSGGGDRILGYAFKADIRHYFDSVDHRILLSILRRRISDYQVLWLIKLILEHHKTSVPGRGMPLGNLTSQFFANVYLDELDQYVKHTMKAKYYIRYVDDFVILHRDKATVERWKEEIAVFLRKNLELELHPEKSKIIPVQKGIALLGFRVFYHYKLLKKSNSRRIWKRLERFRQKYEKNELERKEVVRSLEGWFAYAEFANSYNLRRRIAARFNEMFGSKK